MAGGIHGRGHACQGVCMAGGMCGKGHAWQGACMACMPPNHACPLVDRQTPVKTQPSQILFVGSNNNYIMLLRCTKFCFIK